MKRNSIALLSMLGGLLYLGCILLAWRLGPEVADGIAATLLLACAALLLEGVIRQGLDSAATALLIMGAGYALCLLIRPPLPSTLIRMYTAMIALAALLYISVNQERLSELRRSLPEFLRGGNVFSKLFLALFPLAVGSWVYAKAKPELEPPAGLRIVHPEPPAEITFQGRSLKISGLENPLRKNPDQLSRFMQEGKAIYYKNCFFCHGDNLEGKGHFAQGFNPIPANFQDPGTIAQLQESFVFWRVAKGGPGLPRASHPWSSAMPKWEDMLSEEDIWKVILYIYDATGHTPRTWEKVE